MNSSDDGHKLDESRITVNLKCLQKKCLFSLKHQLWKMKTEIEEALKYWFGLSRCSCSFLDYFSRISTLNMFVCIGCQSVGGKETWHSVKNVEEGGTRAKKALQLFHRELSSAPSSSPTLLSWIWMMLNPWEGSCHVRHNCSIGKFLQTDPKASLDNGMSSTGDSVWLHFITPTPFLQQVVFKVFCLCEALIINSRTVVNGFPVKEIHYLTTQFFSYH